MNHVQESSANPRERVLLIVHCLDENFSMESRLSWYRAVHAARRYDTTVLCAEPFADICCDVDPQIPGLRVVTVPHTQLEKILISAPIGFYLAYRLWHQRVVRVARKLNARHRFSLVHQVSYCGYREPGYCWQLDAPFVWGPIGGTQDVPWRFLGQLDVSGAIKEAWRSVANTVQLRFGSRVGHALGSAHTTFVANRDVQNSFRRARRLNLPCVLETGITQIAKEPRARRKPDRPLRVLWTGRLEAWKGLQLLLKAVAGSANDSQIQLRVVGSGSRERRLRKLATKLGLDSQVEWVPLPPYAQRSEHYEWADVFAFTSLRDTSGTGLLESLAAGVPIVGLNHQGARDIMTADCALPIEVTSPRHVIGTLRAHLTRLSQDADLLQTLSRGALERAHDYHWDKLGEAMLTCYADALQSGTPAVIPQNSQQEVALQQTSSAVG